MYLSYPTSPTCFTNFREYSTVYTHSRVSFSFSSHFSLLFSKPTQHTEFTSLFNSTLFFPSTLASPSSMASTTSFLLPHSVPISCTRNRARNSQHCQLSFPFSAIPISLKSLQLNQRHHLANGFHRIRRNPQGFSVRCEASNGRVITNNTSHHTHISF